MRILFIVPYTPTPIRTRPYYFLRTLARQGHQVTLGTLWETEDERQALEALQKTGLEVVAAPLNKPRQMMNLAQAVFNGKPLQANYCWQPRLSRDLVGLLNDGHRYEVIHVEHLRGAVYSEQLNKSLAQIKPPIPLVWDSVDNISSLFAQAARSSTAGFGRWVTRLELPRTRRFEAYLAGRFDRLLVTSPLDRQAFLELCQPAGAPAPIEVLPNGVDQEYFSPGEAARQENSLVFSGKMSYHANITAAKYLVEAVMPLVWQRRPEVKVSLVGKDPSAELLRLAQGDRRIQVTGTVADLRPYLRTASVAVAPMTYGAGIQNKVLEAMACGTPVVCTSKAVSALSAVAGRDYLQGDEASELAAQILKLLKDEQLRQVTGENGRKYVQQHHDWNRITQRLVEIYEDILNSPGRHAGTK